MLVARPRATNAIPRGAVETDYYDLTKEEDTTVFDLRATRRQSYCCWVAYSLSALLNINTF